jgi:DNA-binding MarR family transcriptional regulator
MVKLTDYFDIVNTVDQMPPAAAPRSPRRPGDVIDDDHDFRARLAAAKSANFGHLLFRAARLLNDRSVQRVRRAAGSLGQIRAAHTQIFPHVDLEGTRQTELARRVGLTKQAVGQLVGDLEALGIVERVPDPEDGRARLVRFTAAGRASLLEGLGLIGEVVDELRDEVGGARIDRMTRDLSKLLEALEAGDPD